MHFELTYWYRLILLQWWLLQFVPLALGICRWYVDELKSSKWVLCHVYYLKAKLKIKQICTYLFKCNKTATVCLQHSEVPALHEQKNCLRSNLNWFELFIFTFSNFPVISWGISEILEVWITNDFMVIFGSYENKAV